MVVSLDHLKKAFRTQVLWYQKENVLLIISKSHQYNRKI